MTTVPPVPATTPQTSTATHTRRPEQTELGRHSRAFWIAAVAFLVNMGFSAVPTPLYVLYQQRDHFSTIMITVVYAVYAVGVIGSLFLGGHVSDWVGRKRILVPALLLDVVVAVVFLLAPSLPGLLIARVLNGISVGLTTATATAYLSELHLRSRAGRSGSPRRAQVVATAANLGGIGFGPLVSGLLAQFAPAPLKLPYIVFGIALLVLAGLAAVSPETRQPVPTRWRPQRVAVPAEARGRFFAAVGAGVAAFAVFGVFNSLAPSFLAGILHEHSHALAGFVAFAAFASGAVAQILLSRLGVAATLRVGVPTIVVGLGLLIAGMWLPSLVTFIIGGVVTGAGGGLIFRGALAAAGSTAPPESRAEVLAGYFLGAYIGLSVPVVALGVATQYWDARKVMVVFVVLAVVAIVWTVGTLLRSQRRADA